MQDYARRSLLALPLLLLMGCATLTFGRTDQGQQASDAIVAEVCQTFTPICYSTRDTPATQSQVQAHNRAHDALCGAPVNPPCAT